MKTLRSYFNNLSTIAVSASLVWRNFLHWNLSKMVVYGYALLASVLFSAIPAVACVYLLRLFVSGLDMAKFGEFIDSQIVSPELLAQIASSWGMLLAIVVLLLVVVAFFIFFFAYAYFLLAKVHDGYLLGKQLPIRENLYFSKSHMRRYFSITAWVSWYLLVPVIAWILCISVMATLQIFSGIRVSDITSIASFMIGGAYILVTVLAALWFFKIAIRCGFAVFLLLDAQKDETGKSLVFRSFELTKGKIWKLIFLALPFMIVLGLIQNSINGFQDSLAKNRSYEYLDSLREESGTWFVNDFEFLSNFYASSLTDPENIDILRIQSRYEEKTDGIRAEYFDAMYPYLDITKTDPYDMPSRTLFYILYFLLFEGIQSMIYLAIFRNTISSLSAWEMNNVKHT